MIRAIATPAAATLVLFLALQPAAQERAAALDSLVEAERAFSRLGGRIGYVAAFLAYFGDDVVTFQPGPTRGKERLRTAAEKMPMPAPVKLDWEPWVAGVAEAGDLGYTSGPSVFTETATGKVVRTGWYFSVWKHDAYGWRVAADIGIQAPAAGALRPRTVESAAPAATPRARRRSLDDVLALERTLSAAAAASGLAAAYRPYLDASSRVHRDGAVPAVGAEDVARLLADQPKPAGWHVVDGGISQSADLAYTYGLFDVTADARDADASGKAGFLHLWKRDANGWRLAADVVTR